MFKSLGPAVTFPGRQQNGEVMPELQAPHEAPAPGPGEEQVPEGASSSTSSPPGVVIEAMTVSPQDVESRRFTVTVRGYDVQEVNDFLATVAESYGAALDAIERLKASREPEDPYVSLGDEVARVLSSARGAAARVKADAEREVEALRARVRDELENAIGLREEAEQEAIALRAQARQAADAIEEEVRRSREQLELQRMETSEDRESLRQAVEDYMRTLREVRRDSADATLGATSLLTDLLARLEQLQGVEEDLMNRLERTGAILATAGSEDAGSP